MEKCGICSAKINVDNVGGSLQDVPKDILKIFPNLKYVGSNCTPCVSCVNILNNMLQKFHQASLDLKDCIKNNKGKNAIVKGEENEPDICSFCRENCLGDSHTWNGDSESDIMSTVQEYMLEMGVYRKNIVSCKNCSTLLKNFICIYKYLKQTNKEIDKHKGKFGGPHFIKEEISIKSETFEEHVPEEFLDITMLSPTDVTTWTHNRSLTLMDLYKKYRNKVGSLNMKNMKNLWEVLAKEINESHGTNFTPAHCENRWRVLERNYKKSVDDSKKTCRRRKIFEFEKEMNEIFELLLSGTCTINSSTKNDPSASSTEEVRQESAVSHRTPSRIRRSKPTKNVILHLMRQDKKKNYQDMLRIQKERLKFAKEKFHKNMELKKRKLEALEQQNKLIKERNEILMKCSKQGILIPIDRAEM